MSDTFSATSALTKIEPSRTGWKLFALAVAFLIGIGDVPKLMQMGALPWWQALVLPFNVAAAVGTIQYAYGRPRISTRFWRNFAPIFCLITASQIGSWLPAGITTLYIVSGSMMAMLGVIVGTGLPLAIAFYANIALLRLGDWLGPTRRPVGGRSRQFILPM